MSLFRTLWREHQLRAAGKMPAEPRKVVKKCARHLRHQAKFLGPPDCGVPLSIGVSVGDDRAMPVFVLVELNKHARRLKVSRSEIITVAVVSICFGIQIGAKR